MPAITAVEVFEFFPRTAAERKSLAARYAPLLMQQWVEADLPIPEVGYLLVHRPGEIGSSQIQMTHRGDEADALEQERGGVAVAITLSHTDEGAETYVALVIRRTDGGEQRIDKDVDDEGMDEGMMEPPDLDHAFLIDGVQACPLAGGEPGERLMPIVQLSLRGVWADRPTIHEALPVHVKAEDARRFAELLVRKADEADRYCADLEAKDGPG